MKKKIRKIIDRGIEFYRRELDRAKKKRLEKKTLYPFGFEYNKKRR